MANVLALQAVLDANTRPFDRKLGDAEGRFHKFGSIIKTGAIAAGAAIGTGLAISAKVGFDEFNEGQKVAAQTAAVLKSTGGAAHVTAKQIDEMATSLMNKTGIDDEAIKSGSNLLLTFTNIRNEAGKGNDIFNQATKTVQDMSVALGQDTKASAIQLGKALNDPIRGITALRRVGVAFTDAQTEQITKLQESGKTMQAQKLILGELQKEFGGSAEAAGKTFAGQLNILKETFSNTAGEIVGRFVPIIVQVTQAVLPLFLKGLDYVVKGLEFLADAISQIVQGVGFGAFGKRTEDDLGRVGQAGIALGEILKSIWAFIKQHIVPIILRLKDIAVETFQRIRKVIEDNRPALERIAERVGKLAQFLARILLPIIKLVFVEVLPRVLSAAIKIIDKVSGAIETVVKWIIKARDWIKDKLGSEKVASVIDHIKDAFGLIADGIETAVGHIKDFAGWFLKVVDAAKWLFEHGGGLLSHLGGGGDGVVGAGIGAAAGGSISSTLSDDIALGQGMGLSVTSGYRPGAITSTGNPSLHGVYPAKAVDMAGSPAAMRAFFLREVARGAMTGLREIIHSPYWWHPGMGITRISDAGVMAGHWDHVHVGSYDKGGYLAPGWNLAYNGLGRPEPVGVGNTYNFNGPVLNGDALLRFIRDEAQNFERRNGRSPF